MANALAYFLTWSTYGTRLHGDERGTVDFRHNHPGTPVLEPDSGRERAMFERLTESPYTLDNATRPVVDRAVRDHAAHRGWDIHALNVRTTHVHVVVNCRGLHGAEQAMQ